MNYNEYKNVYVFAETRDGVIQSVAFELLGKGREIADKTSSKLVALLLGHNVTKEAEKLVHAGADEVLVVDHSCLEHYVTEQYVQAAYHIISERKPNIILIGATSTGRDLAPRLSARLHTGLTADCTKLEVSEEGSLFMTRPAFGGNLMATIICPEHRPQMSTVRPGVMQRIPVDCSRKGEIVKVEVPFDTSKFAVEVVKVEKEDKKSVKIEEAKILVSGGRGAGKENFPLLQELADVIGGTVSGSRAVVDSGIIDHERQVGQTGKTVRPDAYLAFGISGAIQHIAGMEESGFIVAVNKDKFAPIFKIADVGVVGDVKKIVPLLIEEIKKIKAEK